MNDPGDSTLAASASDPATDAEPPDPLSVVIVEEAGDWSGFTAPERAIQQAAAAFVHHPQGRRARGRAVSVVLGDNALVRRLNSTYRGKDKPTNVLSFPYQAPPGIPRNRDLGDIVLAGETIAREAVERSIPPTHHLQHLVVHGLLHLLGFEHATDAEAEAMESIEAEILATLGIADPYAFDTIE
jgi:probable rRNA maturation factor